MDPTAAGLGAAMESWYTQSSVGWKQPWDGSSSRQEMISLWASPEKPHRLIPPTSQHQIEYVQLNVFVQVLGTSLHEFYSIYKWRELIFRRQPNPLEVSAALFLCDKKPRVSERSHLRA